MVNLTFEEIGSRFKEARNISGYDLPEAAEELNVDEKTLINIENGKHEIDSLLLKQLADLYGYSMKYFLEEPGEHQKLSIAFRNNTDEVEREVVNQAKKIMLNFSSLKEIAQEDV